MKNKILIIGASGSFGSELVKLYNKKHLLMTYNTNYPNKQTIKTKTYSLTCSLDFSNLLDRFNKIAENINVLGIKYSYTFSIKKPLLKF